MNLLGVGPFELLLILVIATIVLGPERMAQAGRVLGRLYAQYRLRWQKDVDEMTRELRRELAMLQQEVEDIRQTAETEIKTAQAALESAVDEVELLPGEAIGAAQPDAGAPDEPAQTDEPDAQAQEEASRDAQQDEVKE
jgi:sec-independent protein translocase protein TatB